MRLRLIVCASNFIPVPPFFPPVPVCGFGTFSFSLDFNTLVISTIQFWMYNWFLVTTFFLIYFGLPLFCYTHICLFINVNVNYRWEAKCGQISNYTKRKAAFNFVNYLCGHGAANEYLRIWTNRQCQHAELRCQRRSRRGGCGRWGLSGGHSNPAGF